MKAIDRDGLNVGVEDGRSTTTVGYLERMRFFFTGRTEINEYEKFVPYSQRPSVFRQEAITMALSLLYRRVVSKVHAREMSRDRCHVVSSTPAKDFAQCYGRPWE
jgi:hypothetical protein